MKTLTIVKRENLENILTEFSEPIKNLKKIALQELYMEVSWDKISELYQNSKLKYWKGYEGNDLVISDGFYTLDTLNIRIKRIFFL